MDLFKKGGSLGLLKLSQTFLLPLGLSLGRPLGLAGWRVRRDEVGNVCVRSRAAGFSGPQPELAQLCRGDAACSLLLPSQKGFTLTQNAAVVSPAPTVGICCITVTSNQWKKASR